MQSSTPESGSSFVHGSPALVRDLLARRNFHSPCPDALEDGDLPGRLWELLYALAGLRHYFCATNHLSDREFYRWLHEDWLNRAAEETPVSGVVPVADPVQCTETWLRHYATNEERVEWALSFPGERIPARVPPSQDRDLWLPQPIVLPEAETTEDWLPQDGSVPDLASSLPRDGGTGEEAAGESWEPAEAGGELDACEPERWGRPYDELIRQGVSILPPDEITDEAMPARAWALLHELACRGFYLVNTDHLDDRELYVQIWRVCLREPALLPGRCPTGGWYHDFAAPTMTRTPDEHLWLRYYATEEERGAWAETEGGVGSLPPRETPPWQRDWRLPKGPL